MSPIEALGVALILIALAVPVIIVGVVYYLKKRFEHKQIMTAIEKGTPLSELRPPKQNGALWIKNLTIGIALIIIGLGIGLSGRGGGIIGLVLFAIGVAWVVRAWLNRKYQLQSQPSAKSNAVENKSPLGASTSETLQQSNE
ncbi:unnamed protein product [marine sediment metagenome]|uniref:DUF3784 domain-containing protein n=1 Tax=marine sediment metagenome TaxID=412755 RepID=X1LPL8_9ZZZZ